MENSTIAESKPVLMSSKEIVNRARKFYKDNFKKLWLLFLLGGLGSVNLNFRYNGSNNSVSESLNIPPLGWHVITIISIAFIVTAMVAPCAIPPIAPSPLAIYSSFWKPVIKKFI